MRALDRKLLRDLWRIKSQGLAIALVIASGVAMCIMMLVCFESLRATQQTYYQRYRFADVFAGLKRAPLSLAERIAAIPGVERVATRVVFDVTLDIEGLSEPATGRLISIPVPHRETLDDVAVLSGRYPEPGRPDEVLVSQGFALARAAGPGDTVAAVVNGRRRELEIVGVALSPEYVYTIRPGDLMPDDSRFALFWMDERALAAAFDMEGGFNDVTLKLAPGAEEREVIASLDRLLEPYGGLGAVPRSLQVSHWWLEDQLRQLKDMGLIVPIIFLAVAAFLLSVVMSRIVTVQRPQIAALKALGYSNYEIARHYALSAVAVALLGVAIGVAAGSWLATGMMGIMNEFFRFPFLVYRFSPTVLLGAALVSLAAALLGSASAVRRAVSLPPAEAMRPEPPASYSRTWLERAGLTSWLSQPARMVLRNLRRRPGRALTSIAGIAASASILIVGLFMIGAMDEMLDVQFNVVQRQDLTVTFVQPVSGRALHEIERLPGVMASESMRSVPVRLRHGHRSRQAAITGLAAGSRLQRVIDSSEAPVDLPPEGIVLSATLAEKLEIEAGDDLTVEVLEGARPVRKVRVTALVDEYMGMSVYMEIGALRRLMGEGESLSGAFLEVDPARAEELYDRLKALPRVAGVAVRSAMIESFDKSVKQFIGSTIFFNVLFAAIIAFGVVYNTARISLSERARELASLRVLGFTRAEISSILLGELALLTLLAVPVGLVLGYGFAALAVTAWETEIYRIPLVVSSQVYAASAITVIVAATVSALVVRRRLDRLNLVEALKTRE
ncbi:MAG: ABC transporter permease [bacterium]|nr:ABC transporter permease [bacterium]